MRWGRPEYSGDVALEADDGMENGGHVDVHATPMLCACIGSVWCVCASVCVCVKISS